MQYRYELINIKKERLEGKKMNPASWQVKNEISDLIGLCKTFNFGSKTFNNNRVPFVELLLLGCWSMLEKNF